MDLNLSMDTSGPGFSGSSSLTSPPKTKSEAGQKRGSPKPWRICVNCGATETTQWRFRPNTDEVICNPCILYENRNKIISFRCNSPFSTCSGARRTHSKSFNRCVRPISMKKDTIQRRKRKTKSLESPKGKKFAKKEIEDDGQHNFVSNYALPNFEGVKMKAPGSLLPSYISDVGNQQLVTSNYNPEFNQIQDTYTMSPDVFSSTSSDLLFDNQHQQYYQSVQEPLFFPPPYAMAQMEKIFGNFLR